MLEAQKSELDSLKKLLDTVKEDTVRVKILNTLAYRLRREDPDSSIYLSKDAIRISEKFNFKSGKASGQLYLGTALSVLGKYDEALKQLTEARILFEQLLSSPNKNTKETKSLLAQTINNIGVLYWEQGNLTEALKNYFMALNIRKEIGNNTAEIAYSYTNLGLVYAKQGNYPEAIKNNFACLKIMEELKNLSGVANTYNNIGEVYSDQKNYAVALKYYLLSLKIRNDLKEISGQCESHLNLSNVYFATGNYTEALKNGLASLELHHKIGARRGIALSYDKIGSIYFAQSNYTEALKHHLAALEINKNDGYKPGITDSYKNISQIFLKQNDLSQAIKYAEKALSVAREIGFIIAIQEASEVLFESYKRAGKFKDALVMHELYVQSRDSVINEKNQKEILNQQFKYDYDKKALADSLNFVNQKKISDLKNESDRKAEQNKRYALYGGLGLVLIFSLFIFNRFRVTAKQKKVIEYQNSQIVESINYSKQIQASLLPSLAVMEKELPGLFILYEPKDIVSGDFYWFKSFERYSILACVDCTGHGVPGGFMSTLGSLLLDKIVAGSSSPSEILSSLSTEIIHVLHQQDGGAIQDGMDLSLCLIDHANKTIEFSGARNGIIVVTNGQAKKYKADLYPVGGNYLKKGKAIDRKFTTQKITVDKNDWIYMYTDGFVEQSGGDNGLPMNYAQLESHLVAISNDLSPQEKTNMLQTQLNNWRGGYERTDDVLIMGFRVL